jgi:hypothetical protein
MKFFLQLLFILPALAATGSIQDVYLPPWCDREAFQTFDLEIKDLRVNCVQLDHPCTLFCTNQVVVVSNGIARARLLIDLKKTPATFPIIVLAPDANGRMTPCQRLICHLSLVAQPIQVEVRGDIFTVTNLTEEPFELEHAEAVNITSQDDRHIAGTLNGSGRLKLKGKAEIRLSRKPGPGGPG